MATTVTFVQAAIRALVVCVVIALVAYGGYAVGLYFEARTDVSTTIRAATLVATTVAFVLGFALFVLVIPYAIRFIRCGFHDFIPFISSGLPAFLLLAFSAFCATFNGKPEILPPDPGTQEKLGILFGAPVRHDTVLVPFFPVEGKSGTCNTKQTEFGPAADPKEAKNALKSLVRSLRACTESQRNPVVIDVRGFASSSEFQHCNKVIDGHVDTTVSDQLNLQLAEARRRTVMRIIRENDHAETTPLQKDASDAAGDARITIDPPGDSRWKSIDQMQNARAFNDHKINAPNAGSYDYEKGGLTRRVEIEILNKGSCEPR